jgi:hypothetical protein
VNEDTTDVANASLNSQKDKNSTDNSESVLLDEKTLDTIRYICVQYNYRRVPTAIKL